MIVMMKTVTMIQIRRVERKQEKPSERKTGKRYNKIKNCKKSSFKCEKCEFTGKTEGGLKTHQRIKHKVP